MQKDLGLFDGEAPNAVISDDKQYRYYLSRQWSAVGKTVGFICLNPSTADAELDDQTVRKCIRFVKGWGGGRLVIGNLFAYRSTDPLQLKVATEPIGPDNNLWLRRIVEECDFVIAAWGTHGGLNRRNEEVLRMFEGKFHALRLTKHRHPSHPLYLPEDLTPFEM